MGRKPKFNKEVKIKACEDYKKGKGSFDSIAFNIGCSSETLREWYYRYLSKGPNVFDYSPQNHSYSKELKKEILGLYSLGNNSILELSLQYNINSSVIKNWINYSNNNKAFKDYNFDSNIYNMKSRKATYEEKIKIAKWVIENNMDYKGAADKFAHKYSNVYSWTKKYLLDGELTFRSKAGRPKKTDVRPDELSEIDQLKYELEKEKQLNLEKERELQAQKQKEFKSNNNNNNNNQELDISLFDINSQQNEEFSINMQNYSEISLENLEETLTIATDIAASFSRPILLMKCYLCFSEIYFLQNQQAKAIQYWNEAYEQFFELFMNGNQCILQNAPPNMIERLLQIVKKMTQFLVCLGFDKIEQHLLLFDTYVQLQNVQFVSVNRSIRSASAILGSIDTKDSLFSDENFDIFDLDSKKNSKNKNKNSKKKKIKKSCSKIKRKQNHLKFKKQNH
eukprot:Anaeramoba_ignava/a91816_109.p1 GENE.a91816_109~~a91816_109.p1  ORF type:complete len:452 (-),score=88.07 a91816_109:1402-2757(-)